VLLAFGGAGPMHATEVADELGIREVLIPIFPGNLSALGLLASDQRYERVQTWLTRLATLDQSELLALLARHVDQGRADLRERGFGDDAMRFVHAFDMRYARQAFELTVELADGYHGVEHLRQHFLDGYARQYGHADPAGEIEIVNVRTTSIGVTDKPDIPAVRGGAAMLEDAVIARRPLVCAGHALDAVVYERERLPVAAQFSAPAIVEEDGSTTVLLPGWRGQRDVTGNLRLARSHPLAREE
jgi:N-methylhydantoinase A